MNPHSHHEVSLSDLPGGAWIQPVQAADFAGASAAGMQHKEQGKGTGHSHSHSHDSHSAHSHSSHAAHDATPLSALKEAGRATGHSHAHSHSEAGHAHGHAHSHSSDKKEQGKATGHSHSHAEAGHAHGHAHSHSHAETPKPKPAELGKATGHSHSHSSEPESGKATGHSHSHSSHDDRSHGHSHDDHEGHDHSASTNVGLLILAGMFAFFLIEKTARAQTGKSGGHGHSHGAGGNHGHSHAAPAAAASTASFSFDASTPEGLRQRKAVASSSTATPAAPTPAASGPTSDQYITGILNLIGDFSHNFTDGMAISASYLAGSSIGLSTTLAVLIHEVPHEIGDFAILLQSGFTVGAALRAQLLTAIGALLGCVFGYYSGTTGAAAAQGSWIIPFTAGGFIYVAMVNVLPTLLPHQSLRQTLAECMAMFLGVALMVLIAAFE